MLRSTTFAVVRAGVLGATLGAAATLVPAQSAPPGRDNVVGEAASVSTTERRVLVRKDGGGEVAVSFDEKTLLLRALPGARSLEGATPVQPQELATGDRLLCRGTLDPSGAALAANRIVVMTRGDVEARRQKERDDWQKRGIAGVVSAVDAAAGEFTVRSAGGAAGAAPKTLVVEAAGTAVTFRRYAPSSVRFSDAKPGAFSDLAVGDQVRVLGKRSADGARLTAEQVLSGAFRVVRGVVVDVDLAKGTLSVREGKTPVTVAVGRDTLLRRLPPMMVMRLLRGSEGGAAAPAAGAPAAGGAPAAASSARPADPDEALERLPPTTLAELRKDDEVAVLGPKQTEGTAWPAIKLAAWTMPSFPSGAGNNGRGGRGPGMGGGGADAFSDVLGFGGDSPW